MCCVCAADLRLSAMFGVLMDGRSLNERCVALPSIAVPSSSWVKRSKKNSCFPCSDKPKRPKLPKDKVPHPTKRHISQSATSHKTQHPTKRHISQSATSHKALHPTKRHISQRATSHRAPHPTKRHIPQSATSHKAPNPTKRINLHCNMKY